MLVLIVVVVMMMLVLIVVVVIIVIVVFVMIFVAFCLNLLDPSSRCGHGFPVKLTCVDNLVEVYVTVVALEDFSLWLYGFDDVLQLVEVFGFHLSSLVEQDDVAELYLLDDERRQIFLVDVVLHQVVAACKLVFHSQSVHNGNDAVESQHSVLDVLRTESRNRADGLCDRRRLADAACLNDNVVELLHVDDFLELFHEVHLQRTADASVLQSHERVVFLSYHASLFYEGSIDVHLADIVDDDCKLDAFLVSQNLVE